MHSNLVVTCSLCNDSVRGLGETHVLPSRARPRGELSPTNAMMKAVRLGRPLRTTRPLAQVKTGQSEGSNAACPRSDTAVAKVELPDPKALYARLRGELAQLFSQKPEFRDELVMDLNLPLNSCTLCRSPLLPERVCGRCKADVAAMERELCGYGEAIEDEEEKE